MFYADGYCVGGAEVVLAILVNALAGRVRSTIVATEPEVVAYLEARCPDVAVLGLPVIDGKRDIRAIRAHVGAIRRMRPRLLHVNVGHPWSGQYGILAGLLTPGARVLTVEHSAMAPANGVQRTLRALLNTRLDARVAVADETARRLERTTVAPRGSIEVIHNGVADLAVTSIPQRGSQPTIGFAGRFTHEKGADVLLRALAQLTGVTAVLVGDGELRPASEVLASELGVADRAIFTGWREDARELMATWDVFVLPSRREGFGISIVEAMLAGLPVVATSVGGVPEVVVDGENAILVPPDDPGALAVAIRRLLDDPQLRRRLGQSGRRRALERFSPQTMATAFLALYARLLQDT